MVAVYAGVYHALVSHGGGHKLAVERFIFGYAAFGIIFFSAGGIGVPPAVDKDVGAVDVGGQRAAYHRLIIGYFCAVGGVQREGVHLLVGAHSLEPVYPLCADRRLLCVLRRGVVGYPFGRGLFYGHIDICYLRALAVFGDAGVIEVVQIYRRVRLYSICCNERAVEVVDLYRCPIGIEHHGGPVCAARYIFAEYLRGAFGDAALVAFVIVEVYSAFNGGVRRGKQVCRGRVERSRVVVVETVICEIDAGTYVCHPAEVERHVYFKRLYAVFAALYAEVEGGAHIAEQQSRVERAHIVVLRARKPEVGKRRRGRRAEVGHLLSADVHEQAVDIAEYRHGFAARRLPLPVEIEVVGIAYARGYTVERVSRGTFNNAPGA